MGYSEYWSRMGYFRLDHITNMQIEDKPLKELRTIAGYENGIHYKDFSTSLPYMFTDKIETVIFTVEQWAIDQVIDWFGNSAKIENDEDRYRVSVLVSPNAMEYWAMQYLNAVEILSPAFLRDRIRDNLKKASEKYERK